MEAVMESMVPDVHRVEQESPLEDLRPAEARVCRYDIPHCKIMMCGFCERDVLKIRVKELEAEVERLREDIKTRLISSWVDGCEDFKTRLVSSWLAKLPFCLDHRNKVGGLPCRECEIKQLTKQCEEAWYIFGDVLDQDELLLGMVKDRVIKWLKGKP